MSDRYRVVEANSVEGLVAAVNAAMDEGFGPTGGVVLNHLTWTDERKGYEESETWFYQAMVKPEE